MRTSVVVLLLVLVGLPGCTGLGSSFRHRETEEIRLDRSERRHARRHRYDDELVEGEAVIDGDTLHITLPPEAAPAQPTQQPVNQAGYPQMGMFGQNGQPFVMAGTPIAQADTAACEAVPAIGLGWLNFKFPIPKLLAVPTQPRVQQSVMGMPVMMGNGVYGYPSSQMAFAGAPMVYPGQMAYGGQAIMHGQGFLPGQAMLGGQTVLPAQGLVSSQALLGAQPVQTTQVVAAPMAPAATSDGTAQKCAAQAEELEKVRKENDEVKRELQEIKSALLQRARSAAQAQTQPPEPKPAVSEPKPAASETEAAPAKK